MKRAIAGSCVFAVFDRDALIDEMTKTNVWNQIAPPAMFTAAGNITTQYEDGNFTNALQLTKWNAKSAAYGINTRNIATTISNPDGTVDVWNVNNGTASNTNGYIRDRNQAVASEESWTTWAGIEKVRDLLSKNYSPVELAKQYKKELEEENKKLENKELSEEERKKIESRIADLNDLISRGDTSNLAKAFAMVQEGKSTSEIAKHMFGNYDKSIEQIIAVCVFRNAVVQALNEYPNYALNTFEDGAMANDVYGKGTLAKPTATNGTMYEINMPQGFGMIRHNNVIYADMLPPVDVILTFANEYGQAAFQKIYDLDFLNEGSGVSVDSIVMEKEMTWIARRLSPMMSGVYTSSEGRIKPQPVIKTVTGAGTSLFGDHDSSRL